MPNSRFHLSGSVTFGTPLGTICSVTAVSVPGCLPSIVTHFTDGGRLELSAATAAELARRLPEAIAALRKQPDCSGAWVDVEAL